jgi:cytoplasmic iron level regulating protein YaaA (DUF328/UPF0246 family)
LISCTKSKQSYPYKAWEMYSPSNLFSKVYAYATKNYDFVAILSAKYGLLFPDDEIEPYDLTLNTMKSQQRKDWAKKVFTQMKNRLKLNDFDKIFFHAGKKYREHLIPMFESTAIKCISPLEDKSFGQQLAWYDTKSKSNLASILK